MIQAKKATATKFRMTSDSNNADTAPTVTKNLDQLGIKLRAVNEAGADLRRQTGDPAIYSR
jgi:precorrin-4 methylase